MTLQKNHTLVELVVKSKHAGVAGCQLTAYYIDIYIHASVRCNWLLGKIFNTRSRDVSYACMMFFNCPMVTDVCDKRNKILDKFCTSDNLLCKVVAMQRQSWLCFYRAKLRVAWYCHGKLSVCLSVRLSVTLRYCDHIGWNSAKIISRLISLTLSLSADLNVTDLLQREHPQILAGIGVGQAKLSIFAI